MAKLHKSLVGQVSAATPNNVTTTDSNIHQFRRWYPKVNVTEDTPQAFAKGVQELVAFAVAVSKGEKVEIVDDDGKTVTTLTPTDDVPSKKADKVGEKDGKATIDHGANMAKSLPISFTDLANALNVGIQNLIGRDARSAVVEEYRQGGGKRGRGAVEVDFDEAN